MRFSVLFAAFLSAIHIGAQDSLSLDQKLHFFGDVMINAAEGPNRVYAGEVFVQAMRALVSSDDAFEADYKDIPWISVLEDPDTTFKLITFQLKIDDDNYKYYGFMVFPGDDALELRDINPEVRDAEFMSFTADQWMGGLYYNMIPFMEGKTRRYLLFGYDGHNSMERIKTAEVLEFVDGQPVFGVPSFFTSDDAKDAISRLILKYAADARVTLNYNTGMKMIIYDHLALRMGQLPGQGPTYVPDGTYEGFRLENGKWMYVEKVFDHKYEEAPRPVPVFGEGREDPTKGK